MRGFGRVIALIVILFLIVVWILPVYVMFSASLKPLSEINSGNYLSPPTELRTENWVMAFNTLKNSLKNSFLVSIPATFITVFIGSWSGCAVDIGLFNTFAGMILAYVILNTPMAILITSLFFQTISKELYEASSLDGCTPTRFYFSILLPISLAGITSAAVLTFTNVWNEFIIALSLSRDPTTRLAIPTLAGLKGSYVAQWNMLMAGAAIVSIPGILVLIFLGRFFIKGLTAGALKE